MRPGSGGWKEATVRRKDPQWRDHQTELLKSANRIMIIGIIITSAVSIASILINLKPDIEAMEISQGPLDGCGKIRADAGGKVGSTACIDWTHKRDIVGVGILGFRLTSPALWYSCNAEIVLFEDHNRQIASSSSNCLPSARTDVLHQIYLSIPKDRVRSHAEYRTEVKWSGVYNGRVVGSRTHAVSATLDS